MKRNPDVTAEHLIAGEIFLDQRFPALRALPRAVLCVASPLSPIERITGIPGADDLRIKRDDLNAPLCGGNKVRALEFLLGGVRAGDTVLTLGGVGSTHVLSTTIHARRLGADTIAMRWRHDMNPVAELIAIRNASELSAGRVGRTPLGAILRSQYIRLSRNVHFIPIGGTTPVGVLGHVNAGLELAAQIRDGAMPVPQRIVLPVGSGGTMAGLALGLAIAGLDIPIVGARVGSRMYVGRRRVQRIVRDTARVISSLAGEALPAVRDENLRIVHNVYGGAYGRPLAAGIELAAMLETLSGIKLDDTYSAKAFAAAVDAARAAEGPTLFWLTFDAKAVSG